MAAGRGVPAAAEIEEQKNNLAGVVVVMLRHRFKRWYVPLMCCFSKLWTPRLKLTAHAECIIVVNDFRSVFKVSPSSPRSSRLKSDG